MQQKGNLKGTYRTLDGMDGDTQTQTWVSDTKKGDKLKLEDGLLATDGWSLIDDSRGLLFDNDPDWDWAKERPANEGQDWYFMAYGHDYKQALKDYTLFAGKMPLPPRYAFGYWWSRYWLYSDKEFRNLIDFCSLLNKDYFIPSSLYKDSEEYILLVEFPIEMDNSKIITFMITAEEYGAECSNQRLEGYYLSEHAKLLIKDKAVETLYRMN